MHSIRIGIAMALVAMTAPAIAQDARDGAPAPTAAALAIPPVLPAGAPVLATGTEIPLVLLEQLTTRNRSLRVGERFRLETSEPIQVDGVTVIPIGTPAVGEITEVRNRGMWGRSGRFVARLLYVTVNGRRIRLEGEFDDKGKSGGVGAVVVSALVFLPAGFFMTGTSAELPPGTQITGFIGEDVPLAVRQSEGSVVQAAADAPIAIASPQPSAPPAPDTLPRERAGNSVVRCVTCP
jgi:hypothetical protein